MRTQLLPLATTLLLACDPTKFDLDDEEPEITPFAACAQPDEGWPEETWQQTASLVGLVDEVGAGAPDGCFPDDDPLGGGDADPSAATWIHLVDSSTSAGWTVAVQMASYALPYEVGEEARVEWQYNPPEFGPASGALTMDDFEGALVVWMAEGSSLDSIVPPSGLLISEGDEVGNAGDDCGTWSWHDMKVSTDERSGAVPYGESAKVNEYTVHHGGLVVTDSDDGGCLDWWASRTAVAVEWEWSGGLE